MKSQIKLGTVFGVELGLHYSWFVIALLITFSLLAQFHAANRNWGEPVIWVVAVLTGVLFFACLFAHELSHALVARARGIPIHKITLFLLGGVAQIEKEASDASSEFWMAIVGPITSLVLGAILLAGAGWLGWVPWTRPATPGAAILVWLGYINVALGLFNMIPGFPLDGGRVLHALLWWVMGSAERSMRVAARVGQIIAVLFIAFGILEFFYGAVLSGLWMAFIGWFLLQAAGASYLQVQAGALLRGLRVKDLMSDDFDVVNPDKSLHEFVHDQLLRTGHRFYLVARNGTPLGLVTPQEVRQLEPQVWPSAHVGDVMRPMSKIHYLPPDVPALEALETMAREDVNQLPVMSDGHMEGVVSRANILRVLQARAELKLPPSQPHAA